MRLLQSLVVFLGLAAAAAPIPAQSKSKAAEVVEVEPRDWEHDRSDLPPDPNFNFGALKNGMRYAWINNRNPPKQIFLRLHVDIGSLVESDAEQGMAHFVEHMAFNGTTRFKADSLVATFNKMGIKFGSDVNAHTSFEETVYELDLPDSEPERLKLGMQWMRDVASGLKMEEKEVQKEKGVIDSEQISRDVPGFRAFVDQIGKIADGTLYAKRLPIGVKDVRTKFNGKSCMAFYKRWYRPENMTFIVAGDLGALDPTKLIEEHLGTIPAAKGEPAERPEIGDPSFRHKGFAVETGGSGGSISIAKLRKHKQKKDDAANAAAGVPIQIAMNLVGNRLNAKQDKEKLPFNGAEADLYNFENQLSGPLIRIFCDAAKWRDALTAAERELRRLLEQGCTDEEVKEAWTDYQKTLVPRPASPVPHSLEYVRDLMVACNLRYVPMDDKARKEALRPGAKGLSPDALTKLLREELALGELVIWTEGGIDLGADPHAELMEIWNAAKATDLGQPMAITASAEPEKPKEGEAGGEAGGTPKEGEAKPEPEKKKVDPSKFAYAKPDVVKDATATVKRHEDLKVNELALKNGVKVLYRKADGDVRSLGHWEVRVGEGESVLDVSKHAVAYAAERWFLRGGLAKNDWDTVAAAGGSVGFSVDADGLLFRGNVFVGGELKREFETICAFLTEPGFAQEPWDEWKAKLDEEFKVDEDAGKPSAGSLLGKFTEEVQSTEPRLRRPTKDEVAAVTIDEVRAFLKGQLDGPVRISAAGVDAGKFEKAIFSTFSSLPPRRAGTINEQRRTITPLKSGINARHTVDSGEKSAHLHLLYPCPDAIDAAMARKLALLEDIVSDRLRVEIREKRGGTYSPNAGVWGSNEWRGLGWVTLQLTVDPGKVEEMAKACTTVMEALGSKGATQAELDRLRTAHLGDAETQLKDYDLWFEALKKAQREPAVIDQMRAYKETFAKVTLAEINALAKQVFAKGRESVFAVIPK
ncbi:MAG: insulinase family protein [Planctomycetes bacterium]|nr:insulinase family protein [Planctomycetota bacterium]